MSEREDSVAEPLVDVDAVSFEVGGSILLDDVSLTVDPGSVVALAGPNGAGKSTLLGLIAGDMSPSAGTALVGGRAPRIWKPMELARFRAVMGQQQVATFAYRVRERVEMGRIPHPVDPADADIVQDAMERADVVHLDQRDITTLSGGELARTAFATVLAQAARVVLLDEPTAALDLRHQEAVMRTARSLAERGMCVLVVLHDLSLAGRYADRLALFDRGRLSALGTPAEVLTSERIAAVYHQEVVVMPHPVSGRPMVVPV